MIDDKDIDEKVKGFADQMDREGFGELFAMQGRNDEGNVPLLSGEQAEAIIEAFYRGREQAGKPEPTLDEYQQILHYFTLAMVNTITLRLAENRLLVLDVNEEGEVLTGKREDVDYEGLGIADA